MSRGWLGVSIQTVSPALASALGLDEPRGALVASVLDGSPSEGRLEVVGQRVEVGGGHHWLPRRRPAAHPRRAGGPTNRGPGTGRPA